jgi:hypothetical protein
MVGVWLLNGRLRNPFMLKKIINLAMWLAGSWECLVKPMNLNFNHQKIL